MLEVVKNINHFKFSPKTTSSIKTDKGQELHKIFMGYGSCSVSGCPCSGFKDNYGSDLCGNCGHKYTDHY
jgi:hypothetical protein